MTYSNSTAYDNLAIAEVITGDAFAPTHATIREFCEASLDHNPLHLDDKYVHDNFASKSEFDGIVMHGMSQYSMYMKMLTAWMHPIGGVHRRLETRWLKPVKPGDVVTPSAIITSRQKTERSRWIVLAVKMSNQRGETVSTGEATVEFPQGSKGPE